MNEITYDDQLVAELFDAQPQPVFWMKPVRDANGNISDFEYAYCNEEMLNYVSVQRENLIGKRVSSTITLKDEMRNEILAELRDVYTTGKKFQGSIVNPKLDKYYSYLRTKVQDGVLTIIQDLTMVRQSQLALEANTEQLNTVFNSSQAGMFSLKPVKDEEGKITDFIFTLANEAVAAYIGQTAAVLKGGLGSTYFPAYKTNGLFDIYVDTYDNGTVHDFDFHYEDGYDVFFHIHTVRAGDEVFVTFTDQTALKRTQRELESSIQELKRSNTHLEEFAYAASHDLKEPIRKIHYFSERLKSKYGGLLDQEGLRTFERMEAASERMRSLVDDLLAYSQVSLRPRVWEEIDLNEIVKIVLSDLELEIEEKHAKIESAKLPLVKGHQRQLQQLFQNLLGNALKYSRAGVAPVVRISCQIKNGKDVHPALTPAEQMKSFYEVTISDNGIGFEQKDAERIFNIFQRLHGNAEYKGTGVGLSIARKVAENHDGHLAADGLPGEGATFRLYLPVR